MRHIIYVDDKKVYEFDTLEEMKKQLKKMRTKKTVTTASIPEIKPGLILYRNNQRYGFIVKETSSLYHIYEFRTQDGILMPFLKENLVRYFKTGVFDSVEEYISKEEALKKYDIELEEYNNTFELNDEEVEL